MTLPLCLLVALLIGCTSTGAQEGRPNHQPTANPPSGAAYYVSPSGSDSADGARGAPLRSPGLALSKMAPGDVTYLRGGVYRGRAPVDLRASGRRGAPLTVTAYPGESPLLVLEAGEPGVGRDALRIFGSHVIVSRLRVTNENDPGQGVFIDYGARDVTLSGCEVFGARGQGILVSGAHNTLVDNDVHDNGSADHPATPGEHGIYIEGGGNTLRRNRVHDNRTFGIQLYNGTGRALGGGNLLEENQVLRNGFGTSALDPGAATAGIVVGGGSPRNVLRRNRVCDNAGYGIYLIDRMPGTQLRDNLTCSNRRVGVALREPGEGVSSIGNRSEEDGPAP